MQKLKVGTFDGHKLFSISEDAVTGTSAIVARKRSGKSYTGALSPVTRMSFTPMP